jgi:hypothetical protein
MIDITQVKIDTILEFKKPHPCGGFNWKVLRTGIDFKLECVKCSRVIIISRLDATKRIKKIINNE